MTRRTRFMAGILTLAFIAFGLSVAPTAEAQAKFWLQVVGDDTSNSPITSAYCRVKTAGAATEPTIYTTAALATAATNPISVNTTSGECEWYLDTSTTSVDVDIYVTAGRYKGAVRRILALTRSSDHRVVVAIPSALKTLVVPFTGTSSVGTTSATQTLPGGALVKDVMLETVTVVASSTMDVGIAGLDKLAASAGPVGGGFYCQRHSTATAQTVNCALPAPTIANQALPTGNIIPVSAGAAGKAITWTSQGHSGTKGYIYVHYLHAGGFDSN